MSQTTEAPSTLTFRHERIDDSPPCGSMTASLPTDLTGNGLPDVIVVGTGRGVTLSLPGRTINVDNVPLFKKLYRWWEPNVFWYENRNPRWKRHVISSRGDLYALGAALGDIDGDGRIDLVLGQALGGTDIYWLEQPDDPRRQWTPHLIDDRFEKYHDFVVSDVDGDGDLELVGCSQGSETVFYYDGPADPTVEPGPDECHHVVLVDIQIDIVDSPNRLCVLEEAEEPGGGLLKVDVYVVKFDDRLTRPVDSGRRCGRVTALRGVLLADEWDLGPRLLPVETRAAVVGFDLVERWILCPALLGRERAARVVATPLRDVHRVWTGGKVGNVRWFLHGEVPGVASGISASIIGVHGDVVAAVIQPGQRCVRRERRIPCTV
jgi:hypothetical protein